MARISIKESKMTIQEGLTLKPNFRIPYYRTVGVDIPDVDRNDFPKFLADTGRKVGVEVGIGTGEYGVELCKAGLKVYGIDSYVAYHDYKETRRYDSQYKEAVENLKDYDYTIIKKFSKDAMDDFENESLDFVYIDGNHTFPYVAMDIFGWEAKVRKGGIISGHDYAFVNGVRERRKERVYDGVHVKGAVNVSAFIMRVDRLYILGKETKDEGLKRDKWRSWFWIK